MLKNTVKVTFMDNEFKNFHNIKKVDTNINDSIYRLVHRDGRKTYLFKNNIYSIFCGINVEVE